MSIVRSFTLGMDLLPSKLESRILRALLDQPSLEVFMEAILLVAVVACRHRAWLHQLMDLNLAALPITKALVQAV